MGLEGTTFQKTLIVLLIGFAAADVKGVESAMADSWKYKAKNGLGIYGLGRKLTSLFAAGLDSDAGWKEDAHGAVESVGAAHRMTTRHSRRLRLLEPLVIGDEPGTPEGTHSEDAPSGDPTTPPAEPTTPEPTPTEPTTPEPTPTEPTTPEPTPTEPTTPEPTPTEPTTPEPTPTASARTASTPPAAAAITSQPSPGKPHFDSKLASWLIAVIVVLAALLLIGWCIICIIAAIRCRRNRKEEEAKERLISEAAA